MLTLFCEETKNPRLTKQIAANWPLWTGIDFHRRLQSANCSQFWLSLIWHFRCSTAKSIRPLPTLYPYPCTLYSQTSTSGVRTLLLLFERISNARSQLKNCRKTGKTNAKMLSFRACHVTDTHFMEKYTHKKPEHRRMQWGAPRTVQTKRDGQAGTCTHAKTGNETHDTNSNTNCVNLNKTSEDANEKWYYYDLYAINLYRSLSPAAIHRCNEYTKNGREMNEQNEQKTQVNGLVIWIGAYHK